MIIDRNEFGSINGPIERGIDSLLGESQNPEILERAKKMKVLHEEIKKQTPY
ncbi:MAG: hypothetical protein WC788_05790 [Candidatus Paceibacterota bacterium]